MEQQLAARLGKRQVTAINAGERRAGHSAKDPSLLAGLLFDAAGERMTPSHAVKDGKRYRYYISRPLVSGTRADAPGGVRIPATELEQVVSDRLRAWLADSRIVLDATNSIEKDTEQQRGMIAQAAGLAIAWPQLPSHEQHRVCSNYQRTKAYRSYVEEFSDTALPLRFPEAHAAPNLEPRPEVRPTDPSPIFRRRDDGVEMVQARWWLLPWWHRGGLKEFKLATFNARSETVATARAFRDAYRSRRCLVSAEGWYEWTGEKGKKTKWLFTPKGGPPICFAGLWDRCRTTDAGEVESFTIVTQPAGSALNAYHDRARVVLAQKDWATWLDLDADVRPLLGPEEAADFDVRYVSGPPALLPI